MRSSLLKEAREEVEAVSSGSIDVRTQGATWKKNSYCGERFGFSRDQADLMIKAVEVVDNRGD